MVYGFHQLITAALNQVRPKFLSVLFLTPLQMVPRWHPLTCSCVPLLFTYWNAKTCQLQLWFSSKTNFTENRMKEKKTIFKPLAVIEPHIFGLLDRRVNHYTTRTNRAGNAAS